ncbi:hypothetical protein LCGC14_0668210 [marine sediment metagenome]|uniref:Phospholipase D-like domain-containing protein n=1 Tax=marine sediment metagenome TaxID=412755 RepID=A0A0F9TD63_9ZZZZ
MSTNLSESKGKGWYYYSITHVNVIKDNLKPQEILILPEMDNQDKFSFCFTHLNYDAKRSLYNQIKGIIYEAIEQNTYLLLCSFYLNNSEIIDLLKNASGKLQGKIYVIVGNKQNSYISYTKDLECKQRGFSSLGGYSIQIRFVENAHLKFISNGKTSLMCTTNMTSEGLFRNPEFGLIFNEISVAIALNQLFFYLWFRKSSSFLVNDIWIEIPSAYRQNPNGNNEKNLEKINNSNIILTSKLVIQELNKDYILVNEKSIYECIVEKLSLAKESIDIALYNLFLSSNNKLKKIKTLLKQKAEGSVKIRILVPSVKVNFYSKEMKKELKALEKEKISIRYYRELHGKCIIIDKKEVLLMTGNIDSHLIKDSSYDIGYLTNRTAVVNNFISFYDHLWAEAADECDADIKINLHLDLTIRSYEFISFKPLISVKKLEKILDDSLSVHLFLHESGSLILISGPKKMLNIYFKQSNYKSSEFSGDLLNLAGMVDEQPHMNKKEAVSFSVRKLDLRLFWES